MAIASSRSLRSHKRILYSAEESMRENVPAWAYRKIYHSNQKRYSALLSKPSFTHIHHISMPISQLSLRNPARLKTFVKITERS